MTNVSLINTWTEDDLLLPGVHFEADTKDLCVLFVHGMGGNIVSDAFMNDVGLELAKHNIGCLYTHNRGHSYINNLQTREKSEGSGYKTRMLGMVYERLAECVYDLEAWVQQALRLGYKRVVLMGHSLGGTKVMFYYHRDPRPEIVGVVMVSQGDLLGLITKPEYEPHYNELLAEATKLVQENQPRQLLSRKIWGEHPISAQTFLDEFQAGCPGDNLPLLENPEVYPELASITVPILCTMGEFDDIAIRTLPEDMELIRQKATGTTSFTGVFLKNANHSYMNEGLQLADTLLNYMKDL